MDPLNTLYNIVNECLPLRDVAFPLGKERHMAATFLITNLVSIREARTVARKPPDAIGFR